MSVNARGMWFIYFRFSAVPLAALVVNSQIPLFLQEEMDVDFIDDRIYTYIYMYRYIDIYR